MKRSIIALSLLLAAAALAAQTKEKPLDLSVTHVNDRRSSGSFSRLTISVELPGIKSADVAASRVLLESAVDGAANSLIKEDESEPQMEPNPDTMYPKNDNPPAPARISIELKTPPRDATVVKEVRGSIELFMPSRDPNSVAVVPKFLSQSGKSVSNRVLKANGVEIAIVSKAQLEADRKKQADKKREEAKAEGAEGEDLESAVSNFLDLLFKPEAGDVVLNVKDPNKRIQEMTWLVKAGEEKRAITRDEEGLTVLSMWGETPSPDWSLRVSLKTPKNVVRYPFVLKDIALP